MSFDPWQCLIQLGHPQVLKGPAGKMQKKGPSRLRSTQRGRAPVRSLEAPPTERPWLSLKIQGRRGLSPPAPRGAPGLGVQRRGWSGTACLDKPYPAQTATNKPTTVCTGHRDWCWTSAIWLFRPAAVCSVSCLHYTGMLDCRLFRLVRLPGRLQRPVGGAIGLYQ